MMTQQLLPQGCWNRCVAVSAPVPFQSCLWHRSTGPAGFPPRSSAGAARSPSAVSPDPAVLPGSGPGLRRFAAELLTPCRAEREGKERETLSHFLGSVKADRRQCVLARTHQIKTRARCWQMSRCRNASLSVWRHNEPFANVLSREAEAKLTYLKCYSAFKSN